MRWVSLVCGLLFLSFAVVQYNDPDGLVWVLAYTYAALVSIPPVFGRQTPWPGIGLIVYLVWMATLIGSVGTDWLEVEEAREALGLLLACFWMGVLLYLWVRSRSGQAEPEEQTS